MLEEILNCLSILFVDNYVTKEMSYKEAIKEFAAEKVEKRYYRNMLVCSFSRFYHFYSFFYNFYLYFLLLIFKTNFAFANFSSFS